MCGRLLVAKSKLHVAALVGAAMCSGLRREVMPVGIGAANDGCDRAKSGILVETVFGYEGVKAAAHTRELNGPWRFSLPAQAITCIAGMRTLRLLASKRILTLVAVSG